MEMVQKLISHFLHGFLIHAYQMNENKMWLIRSGHCKLIKRSLYCVIHIVPLIFLPVIYILRIWCDFDRASSLMCENKMPTRCNRGFYCRSYCLLNMFRAPLCPSSGAQEYYTLVAACGISCCGFQVAGLVLYTGSNHCIILLSSWWWA